MIDEYADSDSGLSEKALSGSISTERCLNVKLTDTTVKLMTHSSIWFITVYSFALHSDVTSKKEKTKRQNN